MRDEQQQTVKIELLSQWKLEAEFRNCTIFSNVMGKSIAHPHVNTLVAVCIKVFDRPANNKNVKCVLRSSK